MPRSGRGFRNLPARGRSTSSSSLIRQHADRFPDRYDEWQSYVFYLREFADASGRLPEKFDALLNEVFDPVAQ